MIKPIGPHEIETVFPDEVIKAFNDLLNERGNSPSITIKQDEVMEKVLENFKASGKEVTRHDIFDKHWLDVENTYRQAGWKVTYDKPAYYETYAAYFVFKKK